MLTSQKFLSESEDAALTNVLCGTLNRDTLMIYLLKQYGMRSSELLALKVCDVNKAGPSFYVRGTKGSKDREFPLELHVFKRLLGEMKGKAETDRIFKITYDRLHQIWEFYRPFKKKLHSLRHSVAVSVFKKENNILLVQKVLGHKSISSTQIYLDFFVSQDDYKRVLFK